MDYEVVLHNAKNIYQKLNYVYEHSGNSSLVHDAGEHACIVINYMNLMTKEFNNPIMRSSGITWKTYAEKLSNYLIRAENFLVEITKNS